MRDNYKREIDYLRISVTDSCNFKCLYCMPEEVVKKNYSKILRNEEIENICKLAAKNGITKIRLTGGEPLLRNGLAKLIYKLKEIDNIKEIALTTNGFLLKKMSKELKSAGLDRINVSLDSLRDDVFKKITRGFNLREVLQGLIIAQQSGFENIKINTVLMKDINENEIEDFINLTKEKYCVRFIELMPIGSTSQFANKHFLNAQEVLIRNKNLLLQNENEDSSPAKYYKVESHKYEVGLIRAISCNFCMNCNRLRLTADGKLKPCLHSDVEINIKEVALNDSLLELKIKEAINKKVNHHNITNGEYVKRSMSRIGG